MAGQDCGEQQEPRRDARRSLLLDGYDDTMVSRQSQNALEGGMNAVGLVRSHT